MKLVSVFLVNILFLQNSIDGARVLAIFHSSSRSHNVIGENLLKALFVKGHQVTMVSSLPSNEPIPNYRYIELDELREIAEKIRPLRFTHRNTNTFLVFINAINDLTVKTLKCNEIQKLLTSPDEKFDLILLDAIHSDALLGLREHFDAPIIVISPSVSMGVNYLTGNISPYSFVPHAISKLSDKMTFSQRFLNTAVSLVTELIWRYYLYPGQSRIYKEFFPNGTDFSQVIKNVDLTLFNSNVLLESPRPYLPNMIPIAGMHMQDPKELPQDLRDYLDDAKQGVIFFSMGSNFKSTDMPNEKLEIILNTFKKLPQKIVWKFEDTKLSEKLDTRNIKIDKWFPQSDILAHPNVKLFITHGGMLSLIETIYRGVPIVGVPVFGDQYANIKNFVSNGLGQGIDFQDFAEESFTEAILEVLNNPKYGENVKRYSEIIKDQPMKPLDQAVFWCEHIIRHKNGKHLRSASIDLSLVQFLLLDIIFVTVITIGIICIGIYLVVRTLCCRSLKRNAEKIKCS